MKYLFCKITNYTSALALIFAMFSAVFFVACGNTTAETPETKKESTETKKEGTETKTDDPEAAREVRISSKQYNAINIQLGTLEKKNLANVLKATGFLSVPPQSKASLTSSLGGTVKTIFVQEGDHVRKGETLLTIVNPEFIKMQQDYLEAQAQLSFAEANYSRQKELSKENVTAKRVLQEAESNYKSLVAKVSSLQNQFNLLGINAPGITSNNILPSISIRSPINGNVAKINVNLGLTVDPSTTLMQVVDNSHLHLDLFVYEQDLLKVKLDQNIDFSLTNLPGKNFTAKIYSIGSAFENETKTIPVHAEITSDRTGLIEGMNVTGLINIGENLTTAVLSSAVASYSGTDYVFVQRQDSAHAASKNANGEPMFTFERIRVKKGITNGGYTEIEPLEAIPDNVKVVTNGAFYLMAILTNAGEDE